MHRKAEAKAFAFLEFIAYIGSGDVCYVNELFACLFTESGGCPSCVSCSREIYNHIAKIM